MVAQRRPSIHNTTIEIVSEEPRSYGLSAVKTGTSVNEH